MENANFSPSVSKCGNGHNAPLPGSTRADPGGGTRTRSVLGQKFNQPPRKYKKSHLPSEFMQSEVRITECVDMINELLSMRAEQEEIDSVYEKFVNMYHQELSCFLKEAKLTPRSKRAIRHTKNLTGQKH